jgi:hypothetical protein
MSELTADQVRNRPAFGARAAYPLLLAAVALLPVIVTLLLVHVGLRASLFDFVPATDDEMYYWHQVYTFSAVGFEGGYYTYEEHPAAWSVSRFGAHGPVYPLLYGTLGRLVGWERYTVVFFNLGAVSLAVLAFLALARPRPVQLLWLGLLLATFWPLYWEIVSQMQEAVHLAIALVLAGVFYRLLRRPGPRPLWVTLGFVAALVLASLLRPFWILLLLPYLILTARRPGWPTWLVSAAVSGAAALVVLGIVTYFSAPYPNFIRRLLDAVQVSPLGGARTLAGQVVKHFLRLPTFEAGTPFLDLARLQFLVVLLAVAAACTVVLWRSRPLRQGWRAALVNHPDLVFSLFVGGSITAVLLAFYIPLGYPGFRMFAPYLLLTALLLVMWRRRELAGLVLAINLLLAPSFLSGFTQAKLRNFSYDQAQVAAFAAAIGSDLDYDPKSDAWGNTLLLDGQLLCYEVRCDYITAIPAGRGVSVIFFGPRLQEQIKSKYLLLGDSGLEKLRRFLGDRLHIRWLRTTPVGDLYLNEDCACP